MIIRIFFFLLISSNFALAQNNIKYSLCLNFPKHDFDSNCRNHTIISTFDVNDWLFNLDLDSVRVFVGSENFKKNESVKGQLNLNDFNSVSYKEEKKNGIQTRNKTSGYIANDTSVVINFETGQVLTHTIVNTRIVIEDQFSFQEVWKVDSGFEKIIEYYAISQKQDSFNMQFNKEFPTLFIKNNSSFNRNKLTNIMNISYRIPIGSLDTVLLKSNLLNSTYLFGSKNLKYVTTLEGEVDSSTAKDIFYRYLKGRNHKDWIEIINSKIISMEFKEKWMWDENGVLMKKVLGFGPVFQYEYDGRQVMQVPVYFRY